MAQRYLGEHHANGSAPTWKFLTAVTVGQLAGWGAGALVRRPFQNDARSTQDTAAMFVSTGVFWIVGGLAWLALTRRP